MQKGADIEGEYRYRLWRIWDDSLPLLGWIMLNPSTADADVDDPTIRKCIGFSKRWGWGGIMVTNLFALRATNPKELIGHEDPVGPHNDTFLLAEARACLVTIAAWGTRGSLNGREDQVRTLLEEGDVSPLEHLRLTKAGCPGHPLYIPYSVPEHRNVNNG